MKVKINDGAYLPTRAHPTDAGLDLRSIHRESIPPHEARTIHTGVHVQLPKGTCGLMVSKSGLNVKSDITSTGLIDEGYTGEVLVRLRNHSDKYYDVMPGDKVSQLVVIPCLYEPVELVEEIDGGERSNDGFGSTGR